MAILNFSQVGTKLTQQTTFVNDTGPVFHNDGSGGGYWTPGSGHTTSTSSSVPFNLMTGQRVWSVTAYFNSKLRPPILAPLSFSYTKSKNSSYMYKSVRTFPLSVTSGPGTPGYENASSVETQSMPIPMIPNTVNSLVSQAQAKATQNVLDRLKDSSINAAQAVAERHQTMGLIASTATRVAKAVGSLKKGNFAKAARDLGVTPKKRAGRRFSRDYAIDQGKAVGNAWLELQYGWKPLLSDVYGATEALAKARNPSGNQNTLFKKATGRGKRKESPNIRTDVPISPGVGYNYSIAAGYCEVQCKIGITYAITSPVVSDLKSLGITNPALLAWELLPFSFVADWFVPIGNYIGSLDATLGLTFKNGYRTTVTRYVSNSTTSYNYTTTAGTKLYYGFGTQEVENVTVTRSVLDGFPSAPFPSFKNPLSQSHVASAMALILQNFKR